MQRHLVPTPPLQGSAPAGAPYYAAPPTITPGMPTSPPPTTWPSQPASPQMLPPPAFSPSSPLTPPPIGTGVRPASLTVAAPAQPGVLVSTNEPRRLPPPPAKWLSPADAAAEASAQPAAPPARTKTPREAPETVTDLDHAANLEWSSPGS
ncbi:MAG: hypothetical protein WD176_08645 [Pirellulales bacterium]